MSASGAARLGRLRRALRTLLLGVASVAVLLAAAAGVLYLLARPNMGGAVEGARLARVERSPQWRDGQFRNRLPRVDGAAARMLREFLFGGSDYRSPDAPVPVVRRTGADYRTPPASGLRVTWLGHSTLLLEVDGRRVLIDPMWGERVGDHMAHLTKHDGAALLQ